MIKLVKITPKKKEKCESYIFFTVPENLGWGQGAKGMFSDGGLKFWSNMAGT